MVKLESGNCLLKPSQRRQLYSWLKRSIHLGEQVGDFFLSISVRRVGHLFAIQAKVHDTAGDFTCRARGQTWRDVCRAFVRDLAVRLHQQRLVAAMA